MELDEYRRASHEVWEAMAPGGLPQGEQSRVRSEVVRASEPLRSNGGYDMPGLTLNVLAQEVRRK